jgi:hypothetical protein
MGRRKTAELVHASVCAAPGYRSPVSPRTPHAGWAGVAGRSRVAAPRRGFLLPTTRDQCQ